LMKKTWKRKEVEFDSEGRESWRSFFPKFGRNVIIFCSILNFSTDFWKFRASNFIFPVGSEQRRGGPKKEIGRANNSHFELEFELVLCSCLPSSLRPAEWKSFCELWRKIPNKSGSIFRRSKFPRFQLENCSVLETFPCKVFVFVWWKIVGF
jgi:hypothetical protein